MTEGLAFEPPDEQPGGWQVLDPDGSIVAAGPQTVIESTATTGEEP